MSLNGQWLGRYRGTNTGTLVVDLDDLGDRYEGSAYAIDDAIKLPPAFIRIENVPKGVTTFHLRLPVMAVDRTTGSLVDWEKVRDQHAPDVMPASLAETDWAVGDEQIQVSWKTDVVTSGEAVVARSKAGERSELPAVTGVTTWDEFRSFAKDLEPFRFMFRGQSNSVWRLRTSFHRTGRASMLRFMTQDMPVLHRHLSGVMSHPLDLRDPLQNAAFYNLIQHHGYPTPLLDWTYSPFVAAYFAFGSRAAGDHVRIFVFDKTGWCVDFEPSIVLHPAKLHFTVLEPLATNNPRVIPQQSVLSVTNVDDVEAYLSLRQQQAGKQYLRAIDLPSSERKKVMQELVLMGITAGSLFPGIEGTCQQVKERFFDL